MATRNKNRKTVAYGYLSESKDVATGYGVFVMLRIATGYAQSTYRVNFNS